MAYLPPTGSTVAFQSDPTKLLVHASVSGAISATVNNSSVAVMSAVPHSVATLQGTNPWIVSNTSVAVMSAVPHSVAALQSTNPWITVGSVAVMSAVPHSVAALQGTNPWVVLNVGSVQSSPLPASVSGVGIFNVTHTGAGSIQTVWTTPSIVGTYAEDAAHADGQRGLFTLGVRNDAVASFTSANLDYGPFGIDSAGRTLTKPFAANESAVYGVSSTVNTNPSSLLAGAGTGLRNYITDLWIANTGSVSTLVSFRDGDSSVIGKTIAPAGGGSNIIALATPMRTHALNSQVEFTAGTATSILHVTAFGFKAP